jgi:hypothetical protein
MTKKSDKKKNVVLKAMKPSGYPNELIFGSTTCGIEPLPSKAYIKGVYYTRTEDILKDENENEDNEKED